MSNDYQVRNIGAKGPSAGVSGYTPKRVTYDPALHNPAAPTRPGAEAAMACPSMGMDGTLRPYWGSKT